MTNDTKKEWTPGKRIRHGLIYGFCTALLVLVLEGALRDYVVEGAFRLKIGTTAGGLMLGVLMAAVAEFLCWYFLCRSEKQPGFDRYAFRSYLHSGFWITLGFVGLLSALTTLGGGAVPADVRWNTILSPFFTMVIMSCLLWKGSREGAMIVPWFIHALWLCPLLMVLPGNEVASDMDRTVVTFVLVFTPVFYVAALVLFIRNRKKVRDPKEYIPAGHAVSRRGKKRSREEEQPALSQAFAEAAPAKSAEAEDAPDVAEATDRYAAEKVEDHYL